MWRVLIVGDDHARAAALRSELSDRGYGVVCARDGILGARLVSQVDVAVLSLSEGVSHDAVLERLIATSDGRVPIVIVSPCATSGAPAEAGARPLRAVLGMLEVDFETYRARRQGRDVALSPREFDLLRYLVEHADRVVSRDELLEAVWGASALSLTRTVDVHIAKLRRKIGDSPVRPRFILTIPRAGYRFIASPQHDLHA